MRYLIQLVKGSLSVYNACHAADTKVNTDPNCLKSKSGYYGRLTGITNQAQNTPEEHRCARLGEAGRLEKGNWRLGNS